LAKSWAVKDSSWLAKFHVGREVLFQVFHFGVYGGMHVGIDGGNIGIDFRTSFWVMEKSDDKVLRCDSRSWLWVWAMVKGGTGKGVWVHTEKGLWVKGIMMIRVKRGIQWGRSQIRGSEGGRDHREKKRLKNDRYYCDQNEKRNPMG
jgi:hypothetical protein